MNKHKKSPSGRTKKTIIRTKASKKEVSNKMPSFLSRFIPKSRKSVIVVIVVVAIAGAIPSPYAFTKTTSVSFATENKQDTNMELGDSKILQEGIAGEKTVSVTSFQSAWGRLFGTQPLQQKEKTSTITKAPINKSVANGTRKYQYMLCFNGNYRYYTDEQFMDPNVGFTSKSEDNCKENNQGYKVSLSDNNPSNNGTSSVSRSTSITQPDTYEADKINREVEKLRLCIETDKIIGDEYIGKVNKAQATYNTTEEFNAIVEPAYYKYSYQMKSLNSSGCDMALYPDYTRQ